MSSEKEIEKPAPDASNETDADAGMDRPATNGGDEQDDQILTMQDVLDEQDELEKEYAAVLGGSDHKCCTYAKVNK